MEKIVIIGAGGLGREIFSWLSTPSLEYQVVGFVDDNLNQLDNCKYPCKILSSIEEYVPANGTLHVLAIMNPATKKKVVEKLERKNCDFLTFIHPSCIIGHNVKVGEGCVITPNCILTADIKIGRFVFLNTSTTLGHDVSIGDYVSVNGKVEISGGVVLGSEVLVGSRAVILPKRKIVSGAVIGAGSVVLTHVNKAVTVFGNPAREI
ncbi:MAG: acetyltransferase [Cylindrospermopsis raciborskii]|jgi:sugar O-acyltransferase (sialic acid O-acetyltransferase NeuD family)|uniref:acetyltransferase n=1 Tax=Cylindrospermopsis raciborskii TaxID=77022 RepID=UPI003D096621